MLTNVSAGMSPVSSMVDAVSQVSLGGILRFVSLFYLNDWWSTIRNYQEKDKKEK